MNQFYYKRAEWLKNNLQGEVGVESIFIQRKFSELCRIKNINNLSITPSASKLLSDFLNKNVLKLMENASKMNPAELKTSNIEKLIQENDYSIKKLYDNYSFNKYTEPKDEVKLNIFKNKTTPYIVNHTNIVTDLLVEEQNNLNSIFGFD